jgi:Flp pilus assembly protein TadD
MTRRAALLNDGDLPGARSAFLRALALDPGHLKAHHNLAELESRAATDATAAGGGSAGR